MAKGFLVLVEFVLGLNFISTGIHYAVYTLLTPLAIFYGECHAFSKRFGTMKESNSATFYNYRKLQITGNILNASFRSRLTPTAILFGPAVQIMSWLGLFSMIRYKVGGLQLLIFLVFSIVISGFNVILQTAASLIFVKTRNVIAALNFKVCTKYSYSRKVYRSIRGLRLQYGSNFLGRSTPLVIQLFCISRTATLLILSKKVS